MAVLSWNNFTGGEISPLLSGRADIGIYSAACARMENFIPLIHGPAKRRSGFRFVCPLKEIAPGDKGEDLSAVRLIPYFYSENESFILVFGHCYMRAVTAAGYRMEDETLLELVTPYKASELPGLSFAQSGRRLYLAHKNHTPWSLFKSETGWSLNKVNFYPETEPPTIIHSALVSKYPLGQEPPPLVRQVVYGITSIDQFGKETALSQPSPAIDVPASLDYKSYVQLIWSLPVGAKEFFVYRITGGIPSYIARTTETTFDDMGLLAPDSSRTPKKHLHHFEREGDMPSKAAFFDGRLLLASTEDEPSAIWGSVPGDYSYFVSMDSPKDDCGWKFTLASGQTNKIMWIQPSSKLLIGTSGAEWRMSGDGDGPITPLSVEARQETAWGSADMRALSVGHETLFVDRIRKNVRSFQYANDSAGYTSANLNVYAEHLTRSRKIIDWDYAPAPYSVIWAVTDDGLLLGLTYDLNQRVVAWHRHWTEGFFEAVASIPVQGRDALFAVVRREINGRDAKYVEMMEADYIPSSHKADDAFFVDSGITWRGAPSKEIGGLEHLAGKTVDILADGAAHPKRKVSQEGKIILDMPASIVHAGLHYDSLIETMPIEAEAEDGVSMSRSKRISEIAVRLENTVGLLAGTDEKKLVRASFRDSSAPADAPASLFTGDKRLTVMGSADTKRSVIIKQDAPLPMTLAAIFPRIRDVGR